MAIKNFLPLSRRTDSGALNENFIAEELVKREYQLHYWRTKSKAKVDFILETSGHIIPIEVKTTLNTPAVSRSFRSFLEKYKPSWGIMASNQLMAETTINATTVSCVPHWYLSQLLENRGM